ncbi:MAG: hypothetical protein MUD08_19465 [Cytophagales bacterium]|nr:hypothetical protein [Cytophagales bacterium]
MTLIHKQAELSRANTLEIEKVKGFLSLTDNWDSYGAAIVSTTAVEKAVDFIRNLSKRRENVYFSSPGPNGEVMVQLKKNNKEIEVIFYENKSRYVTFFNNNFSKQGDYSDQILSDLVEWLNING